MQFEIDKNILHFVLSKLFLSTIVLFQDIILDFLECEPGNYSTYSKGLADH